MENTALFVADTRYGKGPGDTVNFPIMSHAYSQTYVPGTDITPTALTATNEQLTIGTWLTASVKIDDTEKKQSIYDIQAGVSSDINRSLKNLVEQAVTTLATSSGSYLDAGNVGGSAGSNITLTTDNAPQVFTAANTRLSSYDAPTSGRIALVGDHFLEYLMLQQANRWTNMGDTVNRVGRIGELFGWQVVRSNNLKTVAVLYMATQPTDGDTVTVCGVTCTLHQTLIAKGTTAGGWADIRTDVDTTRLHLSYFLNGTGGTEDTDWTDCSAENRWLLSQKRKISVVNSAGADTLTITGYGDITFAETLTDATDSFTSVRQSSLFLVQGAPKLALQIAPTIEVKRDPDQPADIVTGLLGYGTKVTADSARKMVEVRINGLPFA